MDAAAARAAPTGLTPVRLWVLAGNARALAFYERYGLPAGRWQVDLPLPLAGRAGTAVELARAAVPPAPSRLSRPGGAATRPDRQQHQQRDADPARRRCCPGTS